MNNYVIISLGNSEAKAVLAAIRKLSLKDDGNVLFDLAKSIENELEMLESFKF